MTHDARRTTGQRGRFIVLDGPDGCGKSTQAGLLVRFLKKAGLAALAAKDPGTTAAGKAIRKILLGRKDIPLSYGTELMLYLAARAQLASEVIGPLLARGVWVVCDRYSSSTIAYQGYGPGLSATGIAQVERLCRISEGGVEPDLTILLDLPSVKGLKRIRRARDRMEGRPLAFHRRVRQGFLEQARRDGRFAVIDAARPSGEIALRIAALAQSLIDARTRSIGSSTRGYA